MYAVGNSISGLLGTFKVADVAIRYSEFIPRFYNLAKSLGFSTGKIMPSRAFCSDESQGYPIILIAKHFGTFPFNHGQVGGIMSNERHGPHAHHGDDLVIIHASHVGYDPKSGDYGQYRRLQTAKQDISTNCGKICATLDWYMQEYQFAKENIFLIKKQDDYHIIIDNQLLHSDRDNGLMLKLEWLIDQSHVNELHPLRSLSTAKEFKISDNFLKKLKQLPLTNEKKQAIGDRLTAELFYFRKTHVDKMEKNLTDAMPFIITSKWPALTAAQVNTQVEFDHSYRSILKESNYYGKNLLFISGINIDISPEAGQLFPLTKFIPWAAFYQNKEGEHETWEQQELYDRIINQPLENSDQVDLEKAIAIMQNEQEIKLPL
jgi:hypothetical protein